MNVIICEREYFQHDWLHIHKTTLLNGMLGNSRQQWEELCAALRSSKECCALTRLSAQASPAGRTAACTDSGRSCPAAPTAAGWGRCCTPDRAARRPGRSSSWCRPGWSPARQLSSSRRTVSQAGRGASPGPAAHISNQVISLLRFCCLLLSDYTTGWGYSHETFHFEQSPSQNAGCASPPSRSSSRSGCPIAAGRCRKVEILFSCRLLRSSWNNVKLADQQWFRSFGEKKLFHLISRCDVKKHL